MASKFSRASHVHGAHSKGGCYTCDFCGKNTRETGHDESDLGICKACYLEAGDINSVNDGNMTEAEFEEIHGKPFYG